MVKSPFSPEPITRARAKLIGDLDRASVRRQHGLFRIEGWRALKSVAAIGAEVEEIVVREESLSQERLELVRSVNARKISTIRSKGMARLSSVIQDQGVAAAARIPDSTLEHLATARRVLALQGVQDPGNVGTLVRTAAWFGADGVIADNNSADFFSPKVVRAAAGGIWDVSLIRVDSLVEPLSRLMTSGFECAGADLDGVDLGAWSVPSRSILVLGSEGHGLSDAVRKLILTFVHLPARYRKTSAVESLNVATAGSILIAHWIK